MKLRPTIFLSGLSSEFASFRDAVEVEVQKKGCFAENQSSFGVDYHTVEEMLRRRINDADAVIHIVGFRFGAELKDRPSDKRRRSYTQMEYDIARELEKPLYVFLSSDASVCDAPGADGAEATRLQLAHRQAIQDDKPLYYFFKDKAELCKLTGEIEAVAYADFRFEISRIQRYAPAELIGREAELKLLDDAWLKVRRAEPKRPHILTFVALGGEGKTSLVAKWAAQLAYEKWPGCDSAFAWSFYSQGSNEQFATSSDLFLKEAILFFGDDADKQFAASPAGAYEKGQRLSRIVGARHALLILDGLEPLQYAPTSPTRGELKDSGIASLLKGLAADSNSLCIVTTRYSLPNLRAYWQTTAPEVQLTHLSLKAGVHLLKKLGVNGSTGEFEQLIEDVKGHALTLNLLGTYLRDAHGGDIRRRDLVTLKEADAEEQGGHAFRVIKAYQEALEDEGENGRRALAILRLFGLFDRPVSAAELGALLQNPPITALTESVVELNEAQCNLTLKRLEDARLITANRDRSSTLLSIDAHPLVRVYFAQQLETEQMEAFRAAHRRLYEYLCASTPDESQPSLEALQPLYQAVAHGCKAGLQQDALNVCKRRIWRGAEVYSVKKLGVFGSDLGAISCFFDQPWSRISSLLTDDGYLLNNAAYCLRALGRLADASEPMRVGMETAAKSEHWENASAGASNLSQLELTLGKVNQAIRDAEQAVTYADRGSDTHNQSIARTTHAHALHQGGQRSAAEKLFRDAEQIHATSQPQYPLLYSTGGFQYCDLLLDAHERFSWQSILNCGDYSQLSRAGFVAVLTRATQTLEWVKNKLGPLNQAVNLLTLGHVALYDVLLFGSPPSTRESKLKTLDDAVSRFRHAGTMHYLPYGLLTRSWLRFLEGGRIGPGSAHQDLEEAWEIAERGPMRLHMADIHLYRARLFFREAEYPWESPEADLAAARKLIEQCGYWRRKEELEDAERVILKKSL